MKLETAGDTMILDCRMRICFSRQQSLGLTLVMGIRDGEAIREMLNIPETENVVAVIAVGYKAKEANMPKRKEVEEIAKFF